MVSIFFSRNMDYNDNFIEFDCLPRNSWNEFCETATSLCVPYSFQSFGNAYRSMFSVLNFLQSILLNTTCTTWVTNKKFHVYLVLLDASNVHSIQLEFF